MSHVEKFGREGHGASARGDFVPTASVADPQPRDRAGDRAQAQQHPHQREAQQRHQNEGRRAERDAGGHAHRVAPQRRRQFQCRTDNQSRGDRPHAAQRAGDERIRGELHVQHRERHHDQQRHRHHSAERRERPAPAEKAIADHQRDIADVRTGQHLPDGEHLEELFLRQPSLVFAQHALGHREHAAESLQRKPGKADKKIEGRRRAGSAVSVTT